jgi:hypothetical protein
MQRAYALRQQKQIKQTKHIQKRENVEQGGND